MRRRARASKRSASSRKACGNPAAPAIESLVDSRPFSSGRSLSGERPFLCPEPSVERIPETDHELVYITRESGRFQRLGQHLVVDDHHSIRCAPLRIGSAVGQNLIPNQALAYAPIVIQQIAEILHVQPELPGVALAADAVKEILEDAQVEPPNHWQEN